MNRIENKQSIPKFQFQYYRNIQSTKCFLGTFSAFSFPLCYLCSKTFHSKFFFQGKSEPFLLRILNDRNTSFAATVVTKKRKWNSQIIIYFSNLYEKFLLSWALFRPPSYFSHHLLTIVIINPNKKKTKSSNGILPILIFVAFLFKFSFHISFFCLWGRTKY